MESIRKRWNDAEFMIKVIIILGMTGIMLFCFSDGINGNDFWWHVKVGEFICKNGYVPKEDVFSWLRWEREIPWTAHEWLSEVILYGGYHFFGEAGIFLFSLGAAFGMCALLWKQVRTTWRNNVMISGLYFCLFAILTNAFFYGRPHVFSFFLLYFELKILYDYYERGEGKGVYFIPVIAMLWSNLHGGSANLAYLLCILFLAAGAFEMRWERLENKKLNKKAWVRLAAVTIGSMLAIFVNPIGIRVFLYPYVNLSDQVSMAVISEWQAPDAKNVGQLVLFFLPIAVTAIGLIFGEKKLRLMDCVIGIFFVFLYMRSARFIALWYIAAPFYAFRYVPVSKIKALKSRLDFAAVMVVGVMLVCFVGYGFGRTATLLGSGKIIAKAAEAEAIEFIRKDAPKRLFNDYNIGETLIFHDVPVFFDARADLYSESGILADGVGLMGLRQVAPSEENTEFDAQAVMTKYGFDAFAIMKFRPLYVYLLSHSEKYVLAYEDDVLGYFKVRK